MTRWRAGRSCLARVWALRGITVGLRSARLGTVPGRHLVGAPGDCGSLGEGRRSTQTAHFCSHSMYIQVNPKAPTLPLGQRADVEQRLRMGRAAGGEPAQRPVVVQWAWGIGPCAFRAAPICPVSPPYPGKSPSCNRGPAPQEQTSAAGPARSRPKTDAPTMADSGLFWSLLVWIQANRGAGADLVTVGASSCLCARCLDSQRYRPLFAVPLR